MSKLRNTVKTITAKFLISSVYAVGKTPLISLFRDLYYHLLKICGMSVFPILNADAYKEKYGNAKITPIRTNRTGVSGNCVYLDNIEEMKTIPMPLPDIRLIEYNDVEIFGNSDIIVDHENHVVICDQCYNHDKELFMVDGMLYRDKDNICILRTNFHEIPEIIDEGIMISGKFSYNYYHQTCENLIRLLLIEESDIPQSVPILIDEKVRQISSLQAILVCLNTSKREAIYLKQQKCYEVKNLYYLDHINKLSPHISHFDEKSYRHFIYDPNYLNKMSELCLRDKSTSKFPKRFYISRKNTLHRKFNDDEIAQALAPYGFETVYPEELSFTEQVALFNMAEFIIGGTGAAFTSLLFCSKDTKIVIINPIANHIKLPVFSTIAYIRNCMLYFYEPETSKSSSVHADCRINTSDLIAKLLNIL